MKKQYCIILKIKRLNNEYLSNINEEKKTKNKNAFNYKHDDEWYTTKEDVEYFIENSKITKRLLNESCSLWTQYENGSFDWVYKLSDEEVKAEYQEITNEKECHCHNCTNCMFYPSIDEMKNKINSREIEFYDYKYDKFGLEFIVEDLFGVNNV